MKNSSAKSYMLLVALSVIIIATSCSRNGYGCHGRSSVITRVK